MLRITSVFCLTLLLTACGGGGSSSEPAPTTPTPTPTPADTVAPVVQLNGSQNLNHEQGTTFTDPGATATDDVDGAVSVTTTGEVGTDAGTYTLNYSATDAAGNTASISRTVVVQDTTAPVVTLVGSNQISLFVGDTYEELGATAVDLVDGEINVSVSGSVSTEQAGQSTLTYSATDTAGNSGMTTRTVTVADTAPNDPDVIMVLDNGLADSRFEGGISAFDAAIDFNECNNDGGAACPSINWRTAQDSERGAVLEVEHPVDADFAGLFVKTAQPLDLTAFADGALLFELRTVSGDDQFTLKLDCVFPCTSDNKDIVFPITNSWQTITVPLAELQQAGLNLSQVDTGIVIWATAHQNTTFQVDDVRFTKSYENESSITIDPNTPSVDYTLTNFGAGTIADIINPASYKCVFDFGNWIYNAGVVAPAIADCITATGTPIGEPTPLFPHVTGPAETKPLASHRWWGSVSFMGEMTNGDPNSAGFITPDPITARISNTGFRMLGIPAGLSVRGNDFGNLIPDPFSEVFDGIAISNSAYSNLQGRAFDHSDGSVTVEWHDQSTPVMRATFVHGSPYVFLDVLEGEIVVKTLREDGGEKGVYFEGDNSLGIWTSVAGNLNHYLITGEGTTEFTNSSSNAIGLSNTANAYTIALMPSDGATPDQAMIDLFESHARNVVASVNIDYSIDDSSQKVTIAHSYLDSAGQPVNTMVGQLPMHWKNTTEVSTNYPHQIRSARGITKFASQSGFSYELPFVGVLPALPTFAEDLDVDKLGAMITEFIEQGSSTWSPLNDTYWSGTAYGKVSELIAIADAIGMTEERDQLLTWLQSELEDWFNAERDGELDTNKYFVYDDNWDTLLGMEESFAAHQQLNDHHFHYGYFVRAAAEVCRHQASWCDDDNYGPMVKLLIRDYAGGKDDELFPYLRHFDPANGFSWASGNVNFVRGNNNESTSEAANAYGAMVLFGMLTGDQEITDRGIYLHASTTNAYWEYWNNIDGYLGTSPESDNFPTGYERITTSIIWGDGAVFSTWFSGAFAHILGIQGLPTNPLTLHVGQYADYLVDYVELGLTESSNNLPSGLVPDQWKDIWWNIWALTDPAASIADYNSVSDYEPEAGETKAHTYHWIHTFNRLGQLATGTGALTADYPAAMAFNDQGSMHYVAYNFGTSTITVTFSDGVQFDVAANSFAVFNP